MTTDERFAVKVRNVTKVYGQGSVAVTALDHVSLEIETGDWVAIVGASGSGKSTLMHLMGGVDQATSGEIEVRGQSLDGLDPTALSVFRRREVGLVYQSFNLIPILTVKENILLPYHLDGRKLDDADVDAFMTAFGIYERKSAFPSELSGGQQQRVAIARALINRPALILADEPTGDLDTENRDAIIGVLGEANRHFAQTIVVVTHDEHVAQSAKRIIQLQDGRIIRDERIRR